MATNAGIIINFGQREMERELNVQVLELGVHWGGGVDWIGRGHCMGNVVYLWFMLLHLINLDK